MSSRTLVAVHRSMERDHDVLPPVRRPYAVSEFRWSATCGGTRSTIRKCQHSDILQPPSPETPIVGADGDRSCSLSTGRDRTTYCTMDYGLCPHFGPGRYGDLSSNATPVTRSSLRPILHHWATYMGGRMGHARLIRISMPPTSATRPRISIHRQL